ncbi:hypothetical protein GA0115255_119952 [Streptomyces sp. Ncost-T6T-2b]|nr:hypothetical protein GA0115255_119952 [Streptomyces sp. Ncost-T6T-2b]
MDRVGHQLLGAPQHARGLPPAVEPARGEDVPEEHGVAEHLPYGGIGTPGLLVAGRGERQLGSLVIGGEGVENGCFVVVPAHSSRLPCCGAGQSGSSSAQGRGVPPVAFMISPVMNEAFAEARKT